MTFALRRFRAELLGDRQLRALLANLPGGERAVAAVEREDAAALREFLQAQVGPDPDAALEELARTLGAFSEDLTRARAAKAAEARQLALENFRATFGDSVSYENY